MLKEYCKTVTIKAEQFDGSQEMIKKYDIQVIERPNFRKDTVLFYLIPTKEDELKVELGDWIATEANGCCWVIKNDEFKKTYEEVG